MRMVKICHFPRSQNWNKKEVLSRFLKYFSTHSCLLKGHYNYSCLGDGNFSRSIKEIL